MENNQETLDRIEYIQMLENRGKYLQEELTKKRHELDVAKERFQKELEHSAKLERALRSVHFNFDFLNEVEG